MSITVILDMTIKPELLDEFLQRFDENLPDSRAFEGCEYVDVYTADDNEARVVCIEGWTSLERFQAYGAWRAEQGDVEAFQKYYDGVPNLVRLDARDVTRG
ncbi:Quinol monooxygenase YgiN [Jatrophihabitans endophyticus]|uniref:Quinol monooxygenase YgiN n=1 Tax=Jatrophihabitans endophyticus TaxID=1206085 RepID=A0A1M5PY43_9ACTN|nr:antibiotic biosynthesis monooxygenase family protein [Jatrophihabitans endophyticus]SHH06572.1 Quinol monooxygenase YgiN [Jatrophihabitans endophyticus]